MRYGRLARSPASDAKPGREQRPSPAPNEAALLDLQRRAGNAAVGALVVARSPLKADAPNLPWPGTIDTRYSAALRKTPAKDPDDPHANTVADLPKDTAVTVTGAARGWLRVEVMIAGKTLTGYVSHELIRRTPVLDLSDEPLVIVGAMSLPKALVSLKRAEVKRAADPRWMPQTPQTEVLEESRKVVEDTGKYEVDPGTFRLSFTKPAGGGKITISTIEDFILFVETVEHQYPSATPRDVAGEVRQLWFSDENWDVLLDSPGIRTRGAAEDIETEPNPIAKQFDMQDLAPARGGKTISTALGDVDIGHVMAGIDATLSGAPSSAPAGKDELKWKTLHDANAGDPRDFATWSGDLGQAYAEYLVSRWVKGESTALQTFVDDKAPRDELLGDIQGYLASTISSSMPADASPTGTEVKVSNILRNLYLVPKDAAGMSGKTYLSFMESSTKMAGDELRLFIVERTLAFARPWYAKKAYEARGWWDSKGWGKKGILENAIKDFDDKHGRNEHSSKENRLGVLVDDLLRLLSQPLP